MLGLKEVVPERGESDEGFTFRVSAGLAQGEPQIEIESVMEFARFNQKPIATFQC